MKTKVYKVIVWYEQFVKVLVEETNENQAKEIARDFVRTTFYNCITTKARVVGTVDNPNFVVNKKYKEPKGE